MKYLISEYRGDKEQGRDHVGEDKLKELEELIQAQEKSL
jgi:hypothetical protein